MSNVSGQRFWACPILLDFVTFGKNFVTDSLWRRIFAHELCQSLSNLNFLTFWQIWSFFKLSMEIKSKRVARKFQITELFLLFTVGQKVIREKFQLQLVKRIFLCLAKVGLFSEIWIILFGQISSKISKLFV